MFFLEKDTTEKNVSISFWCGSARYVWSECAFEMLHLTFLYEFEREMFLVNIQDNFICKKVL